MDEIYIKVKDTIFEDLFKNKDLVSIDDILDELQNKMYEVEELEEKLKESKEEQEEDLEDYFKVRQYERSE